MSPLCLMPALAFPRTRDQAPGALSRSPRKPHFSLCFRRSFYETGYSFSFVHEGAFSSFIGLVKTPNNTWKYTQEKKSNSLLRLPLLPPLLFLEEAMVSNFICKLPVKGQAPLPYHTPLGCCTLLARWEVMQTQESKDALLGVWVTSHGWLVLRWQSPWLNVAHTLFYLKGPYAYRHRPKLVCSFRGSQAQHCIPLDVINGIQSDVSESSSVWLTGECREGRTSFF